MPPEDIIISNKLGWVRTPLTGPEPLFEIGVWEGIGHDAIQKISYDGILECMEQGNQLLGGRYKPQMVSVHDPDEYLNAARSEDNFRRLFRNITEAYKDCQS